MRKILLIVLFVVLSINVYSQNYNWAIGVRGAAAPGLSVKKFVSSATAFEGMVTGRWRGANITGLVEFNYQIAEAPGLDWFFGFGVNIGRWDHPGLIGEEVFLGADGIIGIEYTFETIPLNLALDWKPYYLLINANELVSDEVALSIRFTIQ